MQEALKLKNFYSMLSLCALLILLLMCIITGVSDMIDRYAHQLALHLLPNPFFKQGLSILSDILAPVHCLILVLLILTGLYFYRRKTFWLYGFWCFSVFLIGTVMKYAIARPRPSVAFDGYSFPSMHVLSVSILVSLIILITHHKGVKVIGIVLVCAMILSRVYVNAHYLTDTVGSLLVIAIMLISLAMTETEEDRHEYNQEK